MNAHELAAMTFAIAQSIDSDRAMKDIEALLTEAFNSRKGNSFAGNPTEWFCLDCRPLIHEAVKQGVAQEREECAKVAAKHDELQNHYDEGSSAEHLCMRCGMTIAAQIRARGPDTEVEEIP